MRGREPRNAEIFQPLATVKDCQPRVKISGEIVRDRFVHALRHSSLPYAGSLVLTILIAAYANYVLALLYPPNITIKGQVPAIVIPFIGFPITFVLWLFYKGKPSASKLLQTLFFGLMAVWVVHFVIIHIHHDMYVHTVWLFIPTLLLLALKTPTSEEAWGLLRLIGWTAATLMVLTRIFEIIGFLPQWFVPDPSMALWEREHYWLPFANHWGIESRWAGPFLGNSKTGFVSVLLVLISLVHWRRSNLVLLVIGLLGIVITGGRGVYLSAVAGLLVLLIFSKRGSLSKVPTWSRFAILAIPVGALGIAFLRSPTGSTGRVGGSGIWNSFLDLWRMDIWLGVGQSGISASTGQVHISMDAHSIFLQELVKFGLIGFTAQFAMFALAALICVQAALRGRPVGLAIMTIYAVAGATDLLNDGWQSQSMYTLMILLAATTSTLQSRSQVRGSSNSTLVEAQPSQAR